MDLNPFSSITDFAGKLLDRFVPDPAQKLAAQTELAKMQLSGELANIAGQLAIDLEEAKSPKLFVSGWRPFCGWTCGLGLAYEFLFRPLSTGVATALGHPVPFPDLDIGTLMTCLGGLLGLGTLRTTEKVKGVAAK